MASLSTAETLSIVGILLAAGNGRRFGGQKLLAPLPDGIPVAAAAGTRLMAAVRHCVAVVRPGDTELHGLLSSLGFEIVDNPRADDGMGTSIAAGVAAAADAAGWVVALGDMPWIGPETIRSVADALAQGSSIAAPCTEGIRGHPVGFAARWRDDLLALDGDFGARDLIAAAESTLIPTADRGVIQDIDRPTDLSA
jgi:molybdenum cofactor cytidylyltransferase